MYSLQEILSKTEKQRKAVEKTLDNSAGWHWSDANIYMHQKRSVRRELSESIRAMPLRKIMEALMRSGSGTGIAGANYLVPDKLHSILVFPAKQYDIAPLISAQVLTGWAGGDLDVAIAVEDQYEAKEFTGGGELPTSTVGTTQATITPIAFGVPALITGEMIEDGQWELVEWHITQAGKALGKKSSEMAIDSLDDGDGDGDLNTASAGSGTTTWAQLQTAIEANEVDEFHSDTLLCTHEAYGDAIGSTAAVTPGVFAGPPTEGFHLKVHYLDTLLHTYPILYNSAVCISYVFSRSNALLTGRKRWLSVENYADPVQDLAGAVISARQDSVTLYDDAICKISES